MMYKNETDLLVEMKSARSNIDAAIQYLERLTKLKEVKKPVIKAKAANKFPGDRGVKELKDLFKLLLERIEANGKSTKFMASVCDIYLKQKTLSEKQWASVETDLKVYKLI